MAVSGVGRRAATAATALLAGEEGSAEAAWVNVGIAGHRTLPLGEVVLAHAVTDAASGRVWRLRPGFAPPCPTAAVTTVDRPETSYPEDVVYEMEAAGFCAAATRFAGRELIRVIKVISDNAAASPRHLTAGRVEELIERGIDTIAAIVEQAAAASG